MTALDERWSGPLLAYAETGGFRNPEWMFERAVEPEAYAEAAAGWVRDLGVQIVGGCCGTGPDRIRALSDRLPERLPGR